MVQFGKKTIHGNFSIIFHDTILESCIPFINEFQSIQIYSYFTRVTLYLSEN